MGSDVVEWVTDPVEITRLYDEVIVANFPPEERGSAAELATQVERGDAWVYGARRERAWVAAAVYQRFERESGLVLLSWLAVAAAGRSGGLGSRLLADSLVACCSRPVVSNVLAEIEPLEAPASEVYGDPRARARFYARQGARLIHLPHRQPAVSPDLPEVPLHLLVIPAPGQSGPDELSAADLTHFLRAYRCPDPADPHWCQTLAALAGETVPVGDIPTR